MFPKKNRADKGIITLIFTKGKFVNSAHITLKYLFHNESIYPRVSFVVPKSTAKSAVDRNLLRRRGYKALFPHLKQFSVGFAGVFIFNKKSMEYFGQKNKKSINKTKNKGSMQNLEHEIKDICNKIN